MNKTEDIVVKIIGFIFLAICFFLALALGTQNQEIINFNFLVAQGNFRLSTLLGVVFGLGFVLGWLFCGALYFKARMSNAMLRKQVYKQRQELDTLRIEPVKE